VFPRAGIEPRLAQIFSTRQDKVMFVKADEGLEFSRIAEVIDMGHQAQVDNIGLISPRVSQ
jgi:biopolymer transport protein ExbD/biopolymer transport protein TolR